MKIQHAINVLSSSIEDPREGLPEEIFLFISQVTPLVNVDLLIKDDQNRTLLTWRDDGYCRPGWHIPGGIIRFKETIDTRIKAVARHELGAEVDFAPVPLAINEVIHPSRKIRGHLISLLFRCTLMTPLAESRFYKIGNPKPGDWMWHDTFPENMILVHEMYRQFI